MTNALDTLLRIAENENLVNSNLKYCLVTEKKLPYKLDNTPAKINNINDFVNFEELLNGELEKYAGIGISIQASKVCAIDVDKCFSIPFDITSGDERAKDIINRFKKYAYIEFSFSGKGLRVIFRQKYDFDNKKYYIKNETNSIEYYQPENSYRYVTITGMTIINNPVNSIYNFENVIEQFLNDYMLRPIKNIIREINEVDNNISIDILRKRLRRKLLLDNRFQDVWFSKAPGSGADESERDYYLLSCLYESITQNKENLRILFEESPFFKSKDYKHINKWTNQDHRYFNYLYDRISK